MNTLLKALKKVVGVVIGPSGLKNLCDKYLNQGFDLKLMEYDNSIN